MSLLSRDQYVAVLGASQVALFRRKHDTHELLGSCAVDASQQPVWSAAVSALQQIQGEIAVARGDLRVLLSSDFSRFCLVPWSGEIVSPDELMAFARVYFEEIYGNAVDNWAVRLAPDAAWRPRLAAAIERGLLDGLHTLTRAAGLRLVSVQPYLMTAFNRFVSDIKHNDFLFILAEPGRNSLLLARAGRWEAVRSAASNDSDAALEALIQREAELQALEGEKVEAVYVHAPGRAPFEFAPVRGVVPQTLNVPLPNGQADAKDPLLTMAMMVS